MISRKSRTDSTVSRSSSMQSRPVSRTTSKKLNTIFGLKNRSSTKRSKQQRSESDNCTWQPTERRKHSSATIQRFRTMKVFLQQSSQETQRRSRKLFRTWRTISSQQRPEPSRVSGTRLIHTKSSMKK